MKNKMSFLLLGFIFWQCQDRTQIPVPQNLIPPTQMEDILVDLSLIESMQSSGRGRLVYDYQFSMEYIYQKYKIDSLQLISSRAYYAQHPKDFLEMHKASEYKLERMVDSLNRVKKQQKD